MNSEQDHNPKTIDNEHIDDMANMTAGTIKTKVNIILDFNTASQSNLKIGNDKDIDQELFNGATPIISVTTSAAHINFINKDSLSDEQKELLLDSDPIDFSNKDDVLNKGVHIFPQTAISSFLNTLHKKTHGVDTVHVIGDISGLNVELDTPSLLPKFMTHVNLLEQKNYPFTQSRGNTDFTFWGENNNDAYEKALEKETRQGMISKTVNLDDYDLKSNVILSSDDTPPLFYELDND